MKNIMYSVLVLLMMSRTITVSSQYADPAAPDYEVGFNAWSAAIPAMMILYGMSVYGESGFPYSSYEVQDAITSNYPDFSTNIDDYTQFLPAVAVYVMDWSGLKAKHNFVDRTVMLAISGVATGLFVYGMKEATHVLRPDGSAYTSFPSGHTARAFVTATFMSREYGGRSIWYSVAAYSVATFTGAMRMMNNRHWMSDVFVGAGIGILFTEITYAVYPSIKKALVHGKREQVLILPDYQNGIAGLSIRYRLD